MELCVNGQQQTLAARCTISELLRQLGYDDAFVAVAVNKECVRRRDFADVALSGGDEVEILAPMAGG